MLPKPRRIFNNQRLARARIWRGRVGLFLVAALSMLSGMTDAIGFMATGDFVSFMSGNTTRLAVEVSEGNWRAILHLILVVITFVMGNSVGVVISRKTGRRALPLMLCIAALLCTAALLARAPQVLSLLATVFAMGALNAAVEQVNGLPIGVTYVTGALSRFGRGLGGWLTGERPTGWRVQLVPWSGMLTGAIIGATLEHRLGLDALWFSGALALALGVFFLKVPRRWLLSYTSR
jgi:uncharacterized membrane protein YoaK (UPF0700 family)